MLDGIVDVRLQSGSDAPYFSRRFYANETKQIRIYLHDGNAWSFYKAGFLDE